MRKVARYNGRGKKIEELTAEPPLSYRPCILSFSSSYLDTSYIMIEQSLRSLPTLFLSSFMLFSQHTHTLIYIRTCLWIVYVSTCIQLLLSFFYSSPSIVFIHSFSFSHFFWTLSLLLWFFLLRLAGLVAITLGRSLRNIWCAMRYLRSARSGKYCNAESIHDVLSTCSFSSFSRQRVCFPLFLDC